MSLDAMPVHESWLSDWAPDIKDQKLREELCASPKFRAKIEHELLETHFPGGGDVDAADENLSDVESILPQVNDGLLRQVGLAWFSPVLALQMLGPERNNHQLPASREEMQLMLSFRHHVSPSRLKTPVTEESLINAGRDCFFAWLEAVVPLNMGRLLLRLSRTEPRRASTSLDVNRQVIFDGFARRMGLLEGESA